MTGQVVRSSVRKEQPYDNVFVLFACRTVSVSAIACAPKPSARFNFCSLLPSAAHTSAGLLNWLRQPKSRRLARPSAFISRLRSSCESSSRMSSFGSRSIDIKDMHRNYWLKSVSFSELFLLNGLSLRTIPFYVRGITYSDRSGQGYHCICRFQCSPAQLNAGF